MVAGPGHQALAGSIFNMSTRESDVPQSSLVAMYSYILNSVCSAEIGTGVGLAISTIVQDRVTEREAQRLGVDYDPNAVRCVVPFFPPTFPPGS